MATLQIVSTPAVNPCSDQHATQATQTAQSNALGTTDEFRVNGLASAKTMEVIKQNAMVKESARLTAKYGQANARVKAMNVRIGYSPSIQAVYQKEVDRSSTQVAALPAKGWLVQGTVSGADGKAMSGVTVFLTEDGKSAVQGLPYSCTPATGVYSFALTSEQVDKTKGNANLVLAVSDANKQVVLVDSVKLGTVIAPNKIYARNLVVSDATCTAPPATGGAPAGGAPSSGPAPSEGGASSEGAPAGGGNNLH